MIRQDNDRPPPKGFDTDRNGQAPDAARDKDLIAEAAPDAETREAAKEAIDRATASVGHDDGSR